MKVCIFGLWHLGCVTSACLAYRGHEVIGLDLDQVVINNLSAGDLYENTETIVIGDYNELVNTKDIIEPDVNDEPFQTRFGKLNQETMSLDDPINMEEALDIDDYEVNDDVDERIEALDGYED